MVENSNANSSQNPQRNSRSNTLNPWKNNSQTPNEKQPPPKTDSDSTRNFLERHLEEMKADLMTFIRTTITQAVPSAQPQYMIMQPTNLSQQTQQQTGPLENWTNSSINAQTAPLDRTQTHAHQISNYQHQFPALKPAPQIPAQ